MCDTYNCDYLKQSTLRFNLIDFQLNTDFPSQFCVFVSPERSSERDYVITDSVCSMCM